jgi:DNA-binding NarL/FixJ family response regulator
LAAGARGFVLKTQRNGYLIAAVKKVAEHKMAYSEEALEAALPASQKSCMADTSAQLPDPRLTEREREIICMIASGRRSKEIATTLKISARTADVHKNHITRKLNLHSTAELVHYAIRTGLVEL